MACVKTGYDTIELMTTSTRESLTEIQAYILITEIHGALNELRKSNATNQGFDAPMENV